MLPARSPAEAAEPTVRADDVSPRAIRAMPLMWSPTTWRERRRACHNPAALRPHPHPPRPPAAPAPHRPCPAPLLRTADRTPILRLGAYGARDERDAGAAEGHNQTGPESGHHQAGRAPESMLLA